MEKTELTWHGRRVFKSDEVTDERGTYNILGYFIEDEDGKPWWQPFHRDHEMYSIYDSLK